LSLLLFVSCGEQQSFLERFPDYDEKLVMENLPIDSSNIGLLEGLHCDSSYIVALDFHDNKSYSLFSAKTGKLLSRFGEIGNGRMEIPIGCEGSIFENSFVVFNDEHRLMASYRFAGDSCSSKCNQIWRYKIDGAQFSQILPLDSQCFVGMGTYKDRYHYLLFDKSNRVLSYDFEIYNAKDGKFNTYGKFLANQGKLARHPKEPKFVGTTNLSSNIDFFSVENGSIKRIKSIQLKNPSYTQEEIMGMSRVIPTDDAINGFIDLCATDKYVFALYSEDGLKESHYCSKTILVFDWSGNEKFKINMPNAIDYISVFGNILYTVEKDEKGRHVIRKIKIKY